MASLCLAEEDVNFLWCALVTITDDGRQSGHVNVFVNVEGDKLFIYDPTFPENNLLNSGGWHSSAAQSESEALNEYLGDNGFDDIQVRALFNNQLYVSFNSNQEFYNWF
jgi:hypothetical protein